MKSISELWNSLKWSSVQFEFPKEIWRHEEKVFEKTTAANFPNLIETINLQMREDEQAKAQETRKQPRHIIIKLQGQTSPQKKSRYMHRRKT